MLTWGDVDVAIQATTIDGILQREDMIRSLSDELSRQGVVAVVLPDQIGRPKRSYAAAVESRYGEWGMVLEDDAWISPVFGVEVLRLLDGSDADVATFFSRKRRDLDDWRRFQPLIALHRRPPSHFAMTQCVAFRPRAVVGLVDYAESWAASHPQERNAQDYMLRDWCVMIRLKMETCVPSLVQHRASKSLLGHHGVRDSDTYRLAFGDAPPCS